MRCHFPVQKWDPHFRSIRILVFEIRNGKKSENANYKVVGAGLGLNSD